MEGQSFDAWMDYLSQSIQPEASNDKSKALVATLTELALTKEELGKAREVTTQSWLDSKPLIDELETLQSDVTKTKNKIATATATISTLESELETTKAGIRSKEEAEFKARISTQKMGHVLDQIQSEMDELKIKTGKERRTRAKLKKEMRLRRQSLRALQLTQRAVVLETEAISASLAAALHQIEQSKAEKPPVELSQEEYHVLNRKTDDETSLADRRISASMEQRQSAEASREEALRRLGLSYSKTQSMRRHTLPGVIIEEEQAREKAAKEKIRVNSPPDEEIIRHSNSPQNPQMHEKAKENFATNRLNTEQRRRSQSSKHKKIFKKKKRRLLHQIRSFLACSFGRLFR